MPFLDESFEEPPPLRLLSLDGGGIRGLSSLIILKHLMKRVNHENPPKPCDYFHLIGGTSTGGLIALMLGRLRMDIDTCIKNYLQVSTIAFQPKRSPANIIAKAKDFIKVRGAYSGDGLASEFRKAAKSIEGDEQAPLSDSHPDCRVFVCAFTKSSNQLKLLRSYDASYAVDTSSSSDCKIWEAARATSAAATFFDPMEIAGQEYVDGATGYNNPVELVLDEATSIWKDARSRIQFIVSIGTGVPDLKDFGTNLKEVAQTLKTISTETETTEKRFSKNSPQLGVGGRYFRFNVDKGIRGIGLDEHDKENLRRIETATESYLEDPKVVKILKDFVSAKALPYVIVSGEEKNKYLQWLPYNDPLASHYNARKLRTTKSTGDWFLKDEFERLKTQPRSFTWLNGKAGSGKTVLSSSIIDEIESQRLGALAFFYFSFRDMDTQDLSKFKYTVLTQIVRGLSRKLPDKDGRFYIPWAFRRLYDKYTPSNLPSPEDTDIVLRAVLRQSDNTYIVADALDEAEEHTRLEIVQFLAGLTSSPEYNLHVIITSRREEDIETEIVELPGEKLIIQFNTYEINKDIRNHLQDCMKTTPYRRWGDDLKNEVVRHLSDNANGVFRWADLQLRDLGRKARPKDVRNGLKTLPKTLEKTYERMLASIDEDYVMEAVSMLRWLAFSRRPLLLSEVGEVAAFEWSTSDNGAEVSFSIENRLPNLSWVRRILSGLVVIADINREDPFTASDLSLGTRLAEDQQEGHVSLAHFTVKEYLQSDIVRPALFHLTFEASQYFIVKSCLAYIHFYDDQSKDSESVGGTPYTLLRYACKYIWIHFNTLCRESKGPAKDGYIQEMERWEAELGGEALQLSHRLRTNFYRSRRIPKEFRSCLGQRGFEIGYSDGLYVAALTGELEVVKILLNAGMDIDGWDDWQRTPLHLAAEHGHYAVAGELVRRGCAIDFHDANGVSPLAAAASNGHVDVVRLLLQNGADCQDFGYTCGDDDDIVVPRGNGITYKHRDGRCPFGDDSPSPSYALPLLGKSVFDVDQKALHNLKRTIHYSLTHDKMQFRNYGMNALHLAAVMNHVDVVDALLDGGFDIEKPTFEGSTPLSLAVAAGHADMVRKLVKQGSNIATKLPKRGDNFKRPAPITAVINHNLELKSGGSRILDMLRMDSAFGLLHVAAAEWRPEVVELLLDAGIDVNERAPFYDLSALQMAVAGSFLRIEFIEEARKYTQEEKRDSSRVDTVKVLLGRGADLEARDPYGITALQRAAMSGYTDVVELLLQNDNDIDRIDKLGYTALTHAAIGGSLDMVQLLVEKGASIISSPLSGSWPLIAAIAKEQPEIAIWFLENGAPVNGEVATRCTTPGYTALHIAAEFGQVKMIEILLEKGADIDAKGGNDGLTALMMATMRNKLGAARRLVNAGASLNMATNDLEVTALHWAAGLRRHKMYKFLLEAGADPLVKAVDGSTPADVRDNIEKEASEKEGRESTVSTDTEEEDLDEVTSDLDLPQDDQGA